MLFCPDSPGHRSALDGITPETWTASNRSRWTTLSESASRVRIFEVDRRGLTFFGRQFVADLLAFAEIAQASTFNSADKHKHVCAAGIRLNESETLGAVEPFDGTCCHCLNPLIQ